MGRFQHTSHDEPETGIDMSPLIDCVFILLIFFIVTTTFVEESGIELDKPQAAPPTKMEEKTTIVLTLTAGGQVLHEGREIGLGGIQTVVKAALRYEEVPIIVQAADDAQSGLLLRVVDEARLAGAPRVSVATTSTKG